MHICRWTGPSLYTQLRFIAHVLVTTYNSRPFSLTAQKNNMPLVTKSRGRAINTHGTEWNILPPQFKFNNPPILDRDVWISICRLFSKNRYVFARWMNKNNKRYLICISDPLLERIIFNFIFFHWKNNFEYCNHVSLCIPSCCQIKWSNHMHYIIFPNSARFIFMTVQTILACGNVVCKLKICYR